MYFVITSFHLVRRQPTARPQDFAMLPMGWSLLPLLG